MHVESNKNDYNSKEIYPEVTRILYHLIHDIYFFFKTPQGLQLLTEFEEKKVLKIIFIPFEPYKISNAVKKLNLNHVVITSVDRDDLPDGGSKHFHDVILA